MKKSSLSTKIIGLVVTAVFTVGMCVFASSFYFVNQGFNDQTQQDVGRLADAVQLRVDDVAAKMAAVAQLTAARKDLAEAITKGDTAFVQSLGKEVMRDSKAGFITIADKDGNVVGRGHSDKAGDSVLNQPNVKRALAGEASTGIEEGTVVKFSLRAGAPVKLGGKVVGSVTTGVDLTPASHAFVEDIKKMFDVECTLFQGDARATTTIMKDGQRVIGTKMDNAKVLDAVLAKGQRYLDVNKILGKEYNTAYWPLKDASGKVIGMLFIGKDRSIVASTVRNTELSILAILAVVGALMVFAGILVARSITRPVNRAVTSLAEAAEQVVSASGQVASASQSLAGGASEQAASIEETSSSLEEISSMVKQTADNAAELRKSGESTYQLQKECFKSLSIANDRMGETSEAGDRATKIIKTIDEIAFQTNLLALNAAVEAARAGEAGAGFAVVASEVRNLAMRSAGAARETTGIIDEVTSKIAESSGLVTKSLEIFRTMGESGKRTMTLIQEINDASNEQSRGIDQINKAVTEMEKVTQQTAANAEESASASEEMNAQAEQMKEIAGEVMLIVGSGGSKGAGPGQGEPAKRAESGWKAPFMERMKAVRAKSPGPAGSGKPSKPEEVIPFDKGDFKDF